MSNVAFYQPDIRMQRPISGQSNQFETFPALQPFPCHERPGKDSESGPPKKHETEGKKLGNLV